MQGLRESILGDMGNIEKETTQSIKKDIEDHVRKFLWSTCDMRRDWAIDIDHKKIHAGSLSKPSDPIMNVFSYNNKFYTLPSYRYGSLIMDTDVAENIHELEEIGWKFEDISIEFGPSDVEFSIYDNELAEKGHRAKPLDINLKKAECLSVRTASALCSMENKHIENINHIFPKTHFNYVVLPSMTLYSEEFTKSNPRIDNVDYIVISYSGGQDGLWINGELRPISVGSALGMRKISYNANVFEAFFKKNPDVYDIFIDYNGNKFVSVKGVLEGDTSRYFSKLGHFIGD